VHCGLWGDEKPKERRDDHALRDRAQGIQISQNGKGQAYDNNFVERLWRSVKYEEVYPKTYASVPEAIQNLDAYF
jgi:transposase InsO family protein